MTLDNKPGVGSKRKNECGSPPGKRQRREQPVPCVTPALCHRTLAVSQVPTTGEIHKSVYSTQTFASSRGAREHLARVLADEMERQIAPMVEIASAKHPWGIRNTPFVFPGLLYPDSQVGLDFYIAAPKDAYTHLLAHIHKLDGDTSWDIFGHCIHALFRLGQKLEYSHDIYGGGWSSEPIVRVVRQNVHTPAELDEHFWELNGSV